MSFFENWHQALCSVHVISWRSCATWWQNFPTIDAIFSGLVGLFGALLGAYVGGWINYNYAQEVEVHRAAEAERADQRKHDDAAKSEILAIFIEVIFMTTDLKTLTRIIVEAQIEKKVELERGANLWQAIYKFDLKPAITSTDHRRFIYVHEMGARALMEKLMGFTSAYHSNISRIEQYHAVRDQFEQYMMDDFYMRDGERRYMPSDDHRQLTLEARMTNVMNFLQDDIPHLAAEGDSLLKLIHDAANARFGSAQFLTL